MALVAALLVLAPPATAAPAPPASEFDASLAWAERVLARDLRFTGQPGEVVYRTDLSASNDALAAVLRKYGPQAATYTLLARMNHHRGHNYMAADYATRAVAMGTPDEATRKLAEEMTLLRVEVADLTEATLAWGEHVFFFRPTGSGTYVGMVATPMRYGKDGLDPTGEPKHDVLDGPVVIRVETMGESWGTPQILRFLSQPKRDDEEALARSAGMYWADLDGDSRVELVTEATYPAASAVPTEYAVYRIAPDGELRLAGRVIGPEFALVDDFDGDGKFEFGAVKAIGDRIAHVDQPRWMDVYVLRGDQTVLATREFPDVWRDNDAQIVAALRTYPNDYELLEYRATCLEWAGQKTAARAALRGALRGLDAAGALDFANEPAVLKEESERLEGIRKRIRERITALGG